MAASLIRGIDSPGMRSAGRDLLSVALMDARNHTLHLATQLAGADQRGRQGSAIAVPAVQPLAWELGHIGWFQEWWIARNMQRARGRNCDPRATRLPSLEPSADRWWDDTRVSADDTNEGLYFYRLALAHEDMHGEDLIVMAQATGVPLDIETPGPQPPRAPLLVPAGPWSMGSVDSGGFMFDNEGAQHTVAVPEFEIDAQVVNWAQYVEFVDDGGYDRAELWHPQGWQWLQAKTVAEGSDAGARAPLFVQQIGVASGAVMQNRFGTNRRMQGGQCVTHVSWWEADAWCRWAAGRSGMGNGGPRAQAARVSLGRRVGVDRQHRATVPGFCRRSVARIFAILFRHPQSLAGSLVCHPRTHEESAFQELSVAAV